MAEYVIWLEHQYCRAKDTWDADEREAWYKRRMEWFVELMQLMEVSIKALIEKVDDKIRTTSWEDRDSPDKELIVSHFRTSVQGLREAGKRCYSLIYI